MRSSTSIFSMGRKMAPILRHPDSHLVKAGSEDAILLDFCNRGLLRGRYIPQIGVGRSLEGGLDQEGDESSGIRAIDAVCVLSEPHDYELIRFGVLGAKYGRQHAKKRFKSKESSFAVGPVGLVEVKSGKLDYSAVGQLLVYRNLFMKDFPDSQVEALWIVAKRDDAFIRLACETLGIHVWIAELHEDS